MQIYNFKGEHDSSSIVFNNENIIKYTEYTKKLKNKYLQPKTLDTLPGTPIESLWSKEGTHHLFHACSAIYSDKIYQNDFYSVTLDGLGNYCGGKVYHFFDNQMTLLYTDGFRNSIGNMWNIIGITFFDYKSCVNHGKFGTMMARASLGKVKLDMLAKLKKVRESTNIYQLDENVEDEVVEKNIEELGQLGKFDTFRMRSVFKVHEITEEFKNDLCASLQHFTNLEVAKVFAQIPPKAKRVYFSGGVAHNVSTIKYIEDKFNIEVFTGFAQGDEGISLGYACKHYYIDEKNTYNPVNYRLPYSGNDKCIMGNLSDMNNDLNNNGIIINYMGSPEIGSRALGHRSFLANPTLKGTKLKLDKIKKRETFRPYGVMVLLEDVLEYFLEDIESPYMNKIATPNDNFKKLMSEFVHLDGTVRVQTIDSHIAPEIYKLLNFRKALGDVPVLVNTSLNVDTPMLYNDDESVALEIAKNNNIVAYINGEKNTNASFK